MGKGVPNSLINAQTAAMKENNEISRMWANLGQQYAGATFPYIKPAGDYWSALLKGGTAAQQAVAPAAEGIGQTYAGARNAIQAYMPRGGERNLALSMLPVSQASDIARLYAGVQPTAANALQSLAFGGAGAGSSVGGTGVGYGSNAASYGSNLLRYYGQRAEASGALWGGIAQATGYALGSWLGGKE